MAIRNPIKILSLPSRHPYTSKFDNGRDFTFVNPDTDLLGTGFYNPSFYQKNNPPQKYDLVHVHFSFDSVPLPKFKKLLSYFKTVGKPIVWTLHSKESQRVRNLGNGQYQKLLFNYADKIISPTEGAKKWLEKKFGTHKRGVPVIPLGFIVHPDHVKKENKGVIKSKNVFTFLVGEFRENKEFVQSIINFLHCSELRSVKLQVIFKPINIYRKKYGKLRPEIIDFLKIIKDPRIIKISLPNIPNEVITKAFLKSHAIILPYKWGTHSGQIELAKDCGCHVVVSNVGFYKEQWNKVRLYDVLDGKYEEYPKRFTEALIEVYGEQSLNPAGHGRKIEFEKIIQEHIKAYEEILNNKS
ncbi:MAG: glycosyltransferase [Patescibacteria group bacterium]